MTDLIVLGTDTDAGKTTLSLLLLTAFPDRFEYWKPLETGDSDSEAVRRLVPGAVVHPPVGRYREPVAPALAARREGRVIPPASEVAARRPSAAADRGLLIETFGGPFSPLNDSELQLELVCRLDAPCVLVTSSAVGAVGRALQLLRALATERLTPSSVVLLGSPDDYAEREIEKHARVPVISILPPPTREVSELFEACQRQRVALGRIRTERQSLSDVEFPAVGADRIDTEPRTLSATGQPALTPATQHAPRTTTEPQTLSALDAAFVWHPYSSLQPASPPLPVVSADAEFLTLADGGRLIDALSSWWTILHGHRYPPLVAALKSAADRIDHVLFAGVTHPDAVRFAELILRTCPWTGGRVFYSDNGSTAVEVALKMAYQFWCHRGEPGRTLFVGFEKAYHGDTFGAMAVGRDRLFFGPFEPLLFDAVQLPLDPNRLDEYLAGKGRGVAAVIVEPLVQAAGGMRMHSPDTLRDLVAVARRHGVLVIADEVATGCRTGRRWAFQHAGVVPDLICAAKTLAGGMLPLAVTLVGPEVVSAFDTADRSKSFFHGHSFTAHPLACAVAAAHEELVARPGVLERGRAVGRVLLEHLEPLRGRAGVVDVRGCGSFVAVETDVPGGYLADTAERWKRTALDAGVFLRPLGNVLYTLPPLGCSDESLERIARAIAKCVT